jgi:hypothetical protein
MHIVLVQHHKGKSLLAGQKPAVKQQCVTHAAALVLCAHDTCVSGVHADAAVLLSKVFSSFTSFTVYLLKQSSACSESTAGTPRKTGHLLLQLAPHKVQQP